jgi:hypothetical protein
MLGSLPMAGGHAPSFRCRSRIAAAPTSATNSEKMLDRLTSSPRRKASFHEQKETKRESPSKA